MDGLFSQVAVLGSSGVLLCAIAVLWRHGIAGYISAFKWQSNVLAALTAGLFWGLLYKRTGSALIIIVSHVVWDIAVFLVVPLI